MHATDVVTYRPDGSAELNSGGWRTVTTKERINTFSPARVYSDKGRWYVAIGAGWDRAERVPFEDGMHINADGLPMDPKPEPADLGKLARALDKAVSAYIKTFTATVAAGELAEPSGGDCWGCAFSLTQESAAAHPMEPHGRQEPMGTGHYLDHIGLGAEGEAEVYIVPSLLWNAIRARKYNSPEVIASMIWRNRDTRTVSMVLRAYFRKLKPALLAQLQARAARAAEGVSRG